MKTHTRQADIPTEVFDWGSIKWGITSGYFPGVPATVGEVVINPTMGHDIHTHPESDEVLVILEGEGEQTVGDSGRFTVVAGDSIYIPKGTEHSTFNTGWRQLRILAVYLPGGAEKGLRDAPDYAQLAPGIPPTWVRG